MIFLGEHSFKFGSGDQINPSAITIIDHMHFQVGYPHHGGKGPETKVRLGIDM